MDKISNIPHKYRINIKKQTNKKNTPHIHGRLSFSSLLTGFDSQFNKSKTIPSATDKNQPHLFNMKGSPLEGELGIKT